MAEWARREYSKGEIDRAGVALIPWWTRSAPQPSDLGFHALVIQNWRSSHAMPLLTFRMGLFQRARKVGPNVIVAQRLKRFSSVMNKLAREPHMKLSQMQDLGGCRAILPDIDSVYRLYDLYRGHDSLFEMSGAVRCHDYIEEPKADGYRGIHVVGRYSARVEKNEPWNGHRIEIQLRTGLQHAFATAVETVTTFTRAPLKFGAGPEQWRRFFSLVGSAFAFSEMTSVVPGTPDELDELVDELRDLTRELRVRPRLRAWTRALKTLPRRSLKGAKWLLLVLDVSANTIKVTGFTDRQRASERIAEIETSRGSADLDAVLVWVGSAKNLRAAYPNYYADTREFLSALDDVLRGAAI